MEAHLSLIGQIRLRLLLDKKSRKNVLTRRLGHKRLGEYQNNLSNFMPSMHYTRFIQVNSGNRLKVIKNLVSTNMY